MSKQTETNLFIVSSLPRLYQQLLGGVASYQELGSQIIIEIKTAHAFRQVDRVRELSRVLLNFPIKEYQLIAQYYLVWCDYRELKYHNEVLERILEQTHTYKSQALLSLGTFEIHQSEPERALYFYTEALKNSPTISDYIGASLAISVTKAIEGFRRLALKDMERLLPIIKYAEPRLYYDFLNSYAVELIEAGRRQEARNISHIVIASPFAPAYSEWQDTADELREPNRAFVSVPHIEYKPVEVEPREDHQASEPQQPASLIAFKLKEAPPPAMPERVTAQELDTMTASEKREFILAALRSGAIRESDYNQMIFMLGLFECGPATEVIDLEDKTILDEILIEWANLIEPEQLAGVLSALRDCDDDLRRTNIINNMIRKAFEYSQTCGITEEEWRLKVERKLPKK
jgi:hypothetical protein